MRCLTSAKYNMLADVLKQVARQDPDSGEIRKIWVFDKSISCTVHGILSGGIRVAGTTERFGNVYENIDWIKMFFGPGEPINKQSQVTNIRNQFGDILWREEEVVGSPPSVFDVMGVTPIVDQLTGRLAESTALLERHEIQ